jgi:hypothetical protein
MHIQARAITPTSAFGDDERRSSGGSVSATYGIGVLSDILRILEEQGFNLRSASGRQIELGGEFAFWVDARKGKDRNHDIATRRAAKALAGEGYDTHTVEVHRALLDDVPGALRSFVDGISADGLLIEEISVGTPTAKGRVPVQAYTVLAGAAATKRA